MALLAVFFIALFIGACGVIAGLLLYIHKLNAPRWASEGGRATRGGAAGSCCHDVPCSRQCAERGMTKTLIAASDALQYSDTEQRRMIHDEVRAAIGGQDEGQPAADASLSA
jgi:hypothetical protein